MLDLKDEFTLVISVHERKHRVQECLNKYCDQDFKIIVADSSVKVCELRVDGDKVPVFDLSLIHI